MVLLKLIVQLRGRMKRSLREKQQRKRKIKKNKLQIVLMSMYGLPVKHQELLVSLLRLHHLRNFLLIEISNIGGLDDDAETTLEGALKSFTGRAVQHLHLDWESIRRPSNEHQLL